MSPNAILNHGLLISIILSATFKEDVFVEILLATNYVTTVRYTIIDWYQR